MDEPETVISAENVVEPEKIVEARNVLTALKLFDDPSNATPGNATAPPVGDSVKTCWQAFASSNAQTWCGVTVRSTPHWIVVGVPVTVACALVERSAAEARAMSFRRSIVRT